MNEPLVMQKLRPPTEVQIEEAAALQVAEIERAARYQEDRALPIRELVVDVAAHLRERVYDENPEVADEAWATIRGRARVPKWVLVEPLQPAAWDAIDAYFREFDAR